MHPTEIAAYTYQADNYGPECIARELAARAFPVCPGELDYRDAAEAMLDELAQIRTIDREDERSFDSGDFPKVVFADQVEPGETCGRCGAELDPGSGEQAAIDLALNDCQLWGNLPESAREFYRREAREF